jgi:hypothetical protein
MKNNLLPIMIILRLITNDGILLENRNPKPKQQPPEVRASIRRIWKKGAKNVSV